MDLLQSMKVFVRVAQRSSFAAAARDLRVSAGAVTKNVAALEEHLGVRLFDRTTRRVGMTEAGHLYLERCQECLQAVEDADASVNERNSEPRGVLRVTAPVDLGRPLMSSVVDFMARNPGIVVDLRLSNRTLDLVEEGIDVAVRVARSLDGQYVARPLALSRLCVWGSPAYLRKHGRPRVPRDLLSHRNLLFVAGRLLDEWVFVRDGREQRIKLDPVMISDNGAALRLAAQGGLGLMIAPSFMTGADFAAGLLEPVLLDWSLPVFRVYAVYPHRRFVAPKVRLFVEALRTSYGDGTTDPWWPHAPGSRGGAGVRTRRTSKREARLDDA
jgi:DNA-binding transcriptional LysR family regulator